MLGGGKPWYPGVPFPLTRFGAKFQDVTEWSAAGTQTGSQNLARTLRSPVRGRERLGTRLGGGGQGGPTANVLYSVRRKFPARTI